MWDKSKKFNENVPIEELNEIENQTNLIEKWGKCLPI